MASTFLLAPSPKWYFLDAQGVPAAGGRLTTWSSLDHSTPKFVFSDPTGTFPYTDPIILDATGGTPVPIYWEINGTDLYYVVITDENSNIILTIDNFPLVGGGGSTPITSNIDIENHIVNGAFLFIDAPTTADSVISPIPATTTRIAPASGYFKDSTGSYVPTLGSSKSGWIFEKAGGAGETSSIRFVDVANIGEGFPNAPSANATRFFRYSLTVAGAIQTANVLYQTIPNVEAFSNEILTISLDIHSNANGIGVIEVLQFFGTGSPSTGSVTANFNFVAGDWSRVTVHVIVPSVIGKIKSATGDDCVQIRCRFPLNAIGSFDVTNIQEQRGTFGSPDYIYQDYNQDQYKVLIDLMTIGNAIFKTGELKWMSNTIGSVIFSIPGWIAITDVNQTIGSVASGASFAGNSYKNLYMAWWNSFSNVECIVFAGRGVSALADFNANKSMSVPRGILGTALVGAGNSLFINAPFALLEGERTHALTVNEMPSHTHPSIVPNFNAAQSGTDDTTVTGGNTGPAGGDQPHNNMQPTFYLWLYVKL